MLKTGAGALAVGLTGCLHSGGETGDDGEGDGDESENDTGDRTESEGTTSIGMLYGTGGLGDASFNDAVRNGIEEASDEFGIKFENAEPETADEIDGLQSDFAESDDPDYDLVVCAGFEHRDPLRDNADEYSDQNWTVLDTTVERDNVESWVYAENEVTYLAGEAGARLSSREFSAGGGSTDPSTKVLGFVGGTDIPQVRAFEAGFRAGARSADDDFEVLSEYAGGFDRPDEVRELANSLIDKGADVLLHGAGAGSSGLFEACQERGRFAFGVDTRQSETLPEYSDVILGSIIKGVDTSVFRSVERVVNDEFEGGRTFDVGAGDEGFGIEWGAELRDEIPGDVTNGAEETERAIADGDIEVPDTL